MGNVEFFLTLRCTTQEFAQKLVEHGTIKFGTPQSWVEYEEKYGKGRGDVFEGTFAICHHGDLEQIKKFAEEYKIPDGDIFTYYKNGRLYYKRNTTMNLPCFCLYILRDTAFEIEPREGWQDIQTTIPAEYFKDFSDHKSQSEIEMLPDAKKPAVVVIKDFDAFKERIVKTLLSLGIKRDEILVEAITYYDFEQYGHDGWLEFGQKPPLELGFKSKTFENQSELRFIVNSSNNKAMDYLRNNAIDIGAIDDIAQWYAGYFSEGLEISMRICLERRE